MEPEITQKRSDWEQNCYWLVGRAWSGEHVYKNLQLCTPCCSSTSGKGEKHNNGIVAAILDRKWEKFTTERLRVYVQRM